MFVCLVDPDNSVQLICRPIRLCNPSNSLSISHRFAACGCCVVAVVAVVAVVVAVVAVVAVVV